MQPQKALNRLFQQGRCLLLAPLLLLLASCGRGSIHEQLALADSLVTVNADSTLHILDSIPQPDLSGEDAARWCLLHTWALYRSYAKEIPEEHLESAFDYYSTSTDALRRAQVYYLRSVVHQDQGRGEPREWLEDLYTACLAVAQTGDHVLTAQIYQQYEHKLYNMQQFSDAIVWAGRYVDEAHLSAMPGEEILALTNLSLSQLMDEEQRVKKELNTTDGTLVAEYANFRDAFSSIYQALALARQHGLRRQEGKVCGNISSYYSRTQQLDSALHYALLARQIDEQLLAEGRIKGPINYLHVADIYRKMGQADSAIHYARLCLQCPGISTRRNASQLLYITYSELKGDYKEAFEWMRYYANVQDSIHQQIEAGQIGAAQDAVDKENEKGDLRRQNRDTRAWLVWVVIISIIIVILILVRMVNNRLEFREQSVRQEAEINRMIEEMQRLKKAQSPAPASIPVEAALPAEAPVMSAEVPAELTLSGSTREELRIAPDDILFLTSESNYIKVLYVDGEGKVQSKMLRQTMVRIEEMLAPCPYIVRCHRAFFVNLHHVVHAQSVSTGLSLSLDATSLSVPVSRTYISGIKERLKAQ